MLTYSEAVKELYYSLFGSHPDNFHAVLYLLIQKADPANMARLKLAFPMEVKAFQDWQMSEGSKEFFEPFGLKVRP